MKRTVFIAVAVSAGLSALAVRARAQDKSPFPRQDFSATMVSTGPTGQQVSMKVYRAGDKMRTDMPGGKAYNVVILSQHKVFMVMPQVCLQTPQTAAQPFAWNGKVERTRVGSGTADGHPAIIERLTVTPGGGQKPVTMKVWEATDLKRFPVRIEIPTAKGTARMDYKNVDPSTPPASLFAMPGNCRTMPAMPGMPHPHL